MTHTSAPFVSVLSTADERQHDFWLWTVLYQTESESSFLKSGSEMYADQRRMHFENVRELLTPAYFSLRRIMLHGVITALTGGPKWTFVHCADIRYWGEPPWHWCSDQQCAHASEWVA
jgi:hypothetical protein